MNGNILFRMKSYVALKIVKSASHYTETAVDEMKLLQMVCKEFLSYGFCALVLSSDSDLFQGITLC